MSIANCQGLMEKKHAAINESISLQEEVPHLTSQLEDA
jgi:hypothetical protein